MKLDFRIYIVQFLKLFSLKIYYYPSDEIQLSLKIYYYPSDEIQLSLQ